MASGSHQLNAGHIVGGEFSYACRGYLNNDTLSGIKVYDIRLNMYRDNIGPGADFDGADGLNRGTGPNDRVSLGGHMTVFRGRSIFIREQVLQLGPIRPVDVNLGNPCADPNVPADQQIAVYEFTLELPESAESYTLAYQRCCRNGAILNLSQPEIIGSTYFIEITPEAQTRCNASPRFNIDPPIAICAGFEFQLDLGATDEQGDSLAYKLCDPVVGGGNVNGPTGMDGGAIDGVAPRPESAPPYGIANWAGFNFDTQNQLGRNSELSLDELTGLLAGVPARQGTYSLAVCIEEWSRDETPILLSETKREFQLVVALCGTAVTADLVETELDAQGRFYIQQCGLGENTIFNESTDERFIDRYDWIVNGPEGRITGRGRDFSYSIEEVGEYTGMMILNRTSFAANCRDTAEFLLGVFPGIEPDFEFEDIACEDQPINFTNESTTESDNFITGYSWDFRDSTALVTTTDATHQFTFPGTYPVRLVATDNNLCKDSIDIDVPFFPIPKTVIVPPDGSFGCLPLVKKFPNLSSPISEEYDFEWRFGDGGTSDELSPTYAYDTEGIYDVYLKITSPLGCSVDTTLLEFVDVRQSPMADFFWTPERPTRLAPDFQVFDASQNSLGKKYWVSNANGDRLFATPNASFPYTLRDTSSIFITQVVSHPSGCTDTIVKSLRLAGASTFYVPNAFTPNGDGLNDIFFPKGELNEITEYRFRVWNRWGELVFSTSDPEQGWNGQFREIDSPGGAYLWDAEFLDPLGLEQRFKGGVVLIR
ncbi:PKD domain-containing protein [Lewinella sp. 4G2]|uniref:PKD domain-containing protein n=1 Tax=Lewinella sp. 4G2 TaxID=1803372 RepID=UPI0007B4F0EA|nr:PKD domain-containing protein [Lewinella sp. 4G2]OAV45008.1 hypothetical protein A3850_011140 [Lewinella sp. 4G2]